MRTTIRKLSLNKVKQPKKLDWFRKHLTSTEKNKNFIPSGYSQLDELITGFGRSQISIIGARPMNGKTTLDMNFVYNLPEERHLVFPTENTRAYWFEKMLSRISGIDSREIKTKSRENIKTLEPYIDELESRDIMCVDGYNPRPIDVIRYVEQYAPTMLHIDYFQNMKAFKGDAWEYARILEDLHKIAMDYKIPIILGSQAKRLDSGEDSRPPRPSDLKNTGKQEEAAKLVLMIHQDKGQLNVNVAKNNDGPIGQVKFRPDWATGKLEETV